MDVTHERDEPRPSRGGVTALIFTAILVVVGALILNGLSENVRPDSCFMWSGPGCQ